MPDLIWMVIRAPPPDSTSLKARLDILSPLWPDQRLLVHRGDEDSLTVKHLVPGQTSALRTDGGPGLQKQPIVYPERLVEMNRVVQRHAHPSARVRLLVWLPDIGYHPTVGDPSKNCLVEVVAQWRAMANPAQMPPFPFSDCQRFGGAT